MQDPVNPADKLEAPSAHRNRDPILEQLKTLLPSSGTALEVASGSGEHVLHFAANLPDWHWQPSDPAGEKIRSIRAWRRDHVGTNINAPLEIDAAAEHWDAGADSFDLIYVINMFHVAPIAATHGFFREAARLKSANGMVMTYGPYLRDHGYASDGDEAFDAKLQAENPAWGYRSLAEVTKIAADHGLVLQKSLEMPANNLMLAFQ